KKVEEYIFRLKSLFRNHFTLRYDMIVKLLNAESEQPLLLKALLDIINKRMEIRDRYGFITYLKENNDTYFLESKITPYSNYLSSIYSIFPLVTERLKLEDIVEVIQLREDKNKVCRFVNKPTFNNYNELSYKTKILLLEKS